MATTKNVERKGGRLHYRGYSFPGYNKPTKSPLKNKSNMVLAKKGDQIKIVHFGDPNLSIKKNNKEAKASYCARSAGISTAKDVFSANYWSRKAWGC